MSMNIVFSSDGDPTEDLNSFASFLSQIFLDALGKYAKKRDAIITLEENATREEINGLGDFLQRHIKVDIEDNFDGATLKAKRTEIEKN